MKLKNLSKEKRDFLIIQLFFVFIFLGILLLGNIALLSFIPFLYYISRKFCSLFPFFRFSTKHTKYSNIANMSDLFYFTPFFMFCFAFPFGTLMGIGFLIPSLERSANAIFLFLYIWIWTTGSFFIFSYLTKNAGKLPDKERKGDVSE